MIPVQKIKRQILILVASAFLVLSTTSFALVPAIIAAWEVGNVTVGATMVNSLMASTVAVGSVLSGFAYFRCGDVLKGCRDKAYTGEATAATMPIKVLLKPTDKRQNPDKTRYDDDPAKRDVKPKTSLPPPDKPTQVVPSSWVTVHTALGGQGEAVFAEQSATSTTYRRVKELQFKSGETAPIQIYDDDGSPMTSQWSYSYPTSDANNPGGKAVIYSRSLKLTCPDGYNLNAGACQLVVPSAVKKPLSVPCEVLINDANEFDYDPQNPNCDGAKERYSSASAGSIKTFFSDAANTKIAYSIERTGYGLKTCEDEGDKGHMRCIQTSGFDVTKGGYPVALIEDLPGGSLLNSIDPNTNNNPDPNSSGGGSCGGPNQPACQINDSGFEGKSVGDNTGTELSKSKDAYASRVANGQGDHGITSSGILGDHAFRPRATCDDLVIDFGTFGVARSHFVLDLDVCNNPVLNTIKLFLSWAVYAATLFYVWRKLTGSEGSVAETRQ